MTRKLGMALVARLGLTLLLALGLALVVVPRPAAAAGTVGDGTPGSCLLADLQTAIAGGGTVTFDCGEPTTFTISSEFVISSNTVIDGSNNGNGAITISGNNSTRIFSVALSTSLTLQHLTVTAGNGLGVFLPAWGGAISNQGTLNVTDSTISNSSASFGGAIAMFALSQTTITRSTLSGNIATVQGGGVAVLAGNLTVTNSTISGNTIGVDRFGFGGGIYTAAGASITSSTIANNAAPQGGGIYTIGGTTTIAQTIVADSPSGGNCFVAAGAIASSGYNLSSDTTCAGSFTAMTDQNSTPAGYGALADNGGPTQTHALQKGSDALDAIDPAAATCQPTDQRSVTRPQPAGGFCDIGAFEFEDTTGPVITITSPANGANYSLNEVVLALYSCSDLSGVATCAGPVASGAAIDTSTAGPHDFTVNATDTVGNPSSLTATYTVEGTLSVADISVTRRACVESATHTCANVQVSLRAGGSGVAGADATLAITLPDASTTTQTATTSGRYGVATFTIPIDAYGHYVVTAQSVTPPAFYTYDPSGNAITSRSFDIGSRFRR